MKWSNALCASILIEELYMQRDEKHGSSHLRVELEGDEIVVRKPGTTLLLGYRRSVEEARTRSNAQLCEANQSFPFDRRISSPSTSGRG